MSGRSPRFRRSLSPAARRLAGRCGASWPELASWPTRGCGASWPAWRNPGRASSPGESPGAARAPDRTQPGRSRDRPAPGAPDRQRASLAGFAGQDSRFCRMSRRCSQGRRRPRRFPSRPPLPGHPRLAGLVRRRPLGHALSHPPEVRPVYSHRQLRARLVNRSPYPTRAQVQGQLQGLRLLVGPAAGLGRPQAPGRPRRPSKSRRSCRCR